MWEWLLNIVLVLIPRGSVQVQFWLQLLTPGGLFSWQCKPWQAAVLAQVTVLLPSAWETLVSRNWSSGSWLWDTFARELVGVGDHCQTGIPFCLSAKQIQKKETNNTDWLSIHYTSDQRFRLMLEWDLERYLNKRKKNIYIYILCSHQNSQMNHFKFHGIKQILMLYNYHFHSYPELVAFCRT